MTRQAFEHEMTKAKTLAHLGDRPEYWAGYQRGLRRRFHGETFGTLDEHKQWLALANDTMKPAGSAGWATERALGAINKRQKLAITIPDGLELSALQLSRDPASGSVSFDWKPYLCGQRYRCGDIPLTA